jgi:hypothetical protein
MHKRRGRSREHFLGRRWLSGILSTMVVCLLVVISLSPAQGQSSAPSFTRSGSAAPEGPLTPKQPQTPDLKPPAPGITISTSGAIGTPARFQLPADLSAALDNTALNAPQDWETDFADSFDGAFPGSAWEVLDGSDDGLDRTWGLDDYEFASAPASVWIAAGGADALDPELDYYPDDLDAWMIAGPFDLSAIQAADVEFGMLYDTEPEYDYIFVGASADGQNFDGEYWTGDSGGWEDFDVDLGASVGLDQIWLAWYFHSDESNPDPYEGVWVDDVRLWTYTESGPAQVTNLVDNPGFETGNTSGWTTEGTTIVTGDKAHGGDYSAWLGGVNNASDRLYQALPALPADTNQVGVAFWLRLEGAETNVNADSFCAGIHRDSDDVLLVDLGCADGTEPTFGWSRVVYTLSGAEVVDVAGTDVYIDFSLVTDAERPTAVYIDDVMVGARSSGTAGDSQEPNDAPSTATPLSFGAPISELTIDPTGDFDFFAFTGTSGQEITLDIDASVNGSALDSYLWLVGPDGQTTLAENDDDDNSFDSYLTYSLPADGTYYAVVSSYSGDGDRSFFYTISLTAGGGPAPTPVPTPTTPPVEEKKAWTAILYLAGDTNLWREYRPYIEGLESLIATKSDFLDIVVLLDLAPGAPQPGTVRLHIQPDGNYTDGVNRWNMGELNMGDPRTLENFIRWAINNYPAEQYYLAIDDHGNSVGGIAWDDTSDGDNLRPQELYEVFKQVTNDGAYKLDVVDWEACLMLTYEGAYDMRNFAHYLFGFESASYGGNTYPRYFESLTATTTPHQLAEMALDAYFRDRSDPVVGAVIDLSQMDALRTAVDSLSDSLLAQLETNKDAMTAARDAAQKFEVDGDFRITGQDYYLDLRDLADRLGSQVPAVSGPANAVKAAVASAVADVTVQSSPGEDHENAHGLGVYWPDWVSGAYGDYVNNNLFTVTRDGRWDDFLAEYFGRRGEYGRRGMPVNPDPVEKRSSGSRVFLPLVLTSRQ